MTFLSLFLSILIKLTQFYFSLFYVFLPHFSSLYFYPYHLINLFIDAPHTHCHKTCLFVMTELDRQEGGQTYVSHKTQHANPTVNSDPAGNRPLGVQSISLTNTLQYKY